MTAAVFPEYILDLSSWETRGREVPCHYMSRLPNPFANQSFHLPIVGKTYPRDTLNLTPIPTLEFGWKLIWKHLTVSNSHNKFSEELGTLLFQGAVASWKVCGTASNSEGSGGGQNSKDLRLPHSRNLSLNLNVMKRVSKNSKKTLTQKIKCGDQETVVQKSWLAMSSGAPLHAELV